MDVTTTARNADLPAIVEVLRGQRAQRHDLIVPASFVRAEGGGITIEGDEPAVQLTTDGVEQWPALYTPTDVAEDGISEKLGVHRAYLRKLRERNIPLWDANVNGWVGHDDHADRKLLVRTLREEGSAEGVLRAVLSDRYRPMENLDVVLAALEGIRETGVQVDVDRADLTDHRLYVTMHSPDVAQMAPALLDGYRGPWHQRSLAEQRVDRGGEVGRVGSMLDLAAREGMGYAPGTEPVMFAGFELRNSDVGFGAFELAPKLQVKVCRNGLTMDIGKLRKVHIGGRLEQGAVDWSNQTHEAALELIKRQTVDAIRKFLSPQFLADAISSLEERAGVGVDRPAETIKHVTAKLGYSDERADSILAHFIAGGQSTAGGVMQAVTSVAQTVASGDDAAQMEADGVRAMELAAVFAS